MPHLPYQELPVSDPGTPETRSPGRYLAWLARHQRWLLTLNAFFGIGWMVSQALVWAAVGAAIDHGVERHDSGSLFQWVAIVMALGLFSAACGSFRHQLAVTNWMSATYRTVQLVGRQLARTGSAMTDEIPAGDIVNTVAADAPRIGSVYDSFARFSGAVVAWIAVSFILLSTSVQLGLIVLLGVPLLGSLTVPLMRPLHRTQAAQREQAGRLAALGSDTVAGLRILRGVGGEEVFLNNYRRQSQKVRVTNSSLATTKPAIEVFMSLAILTGIVTFIGAHDVMNGTLQPGQLVAFFGYTTFLTTPLRVAVDYIIMSTRAYVGASRVLRIMAVEPTVSDPEEPLAWPIRLVQLEDRTSGLVLERGQLVGLVTETPDEAAAQVDRLGRFVQDTGGVVLNGAALDTYALSDVRTQIVVSEIEPRLFSGELRYELMPHGLVDDERILQVLAATSSLDVLDALDDGLSTPVEERGRGFSGGQRQRLSLARAILTNADVLLLVEPTSAVDTHTEGRIAARIREVRGEHTTLITTTSPLLLEKMDVVFVEFNERVIDHGTHDELISRSSVYRQIVLREES